jgi:hypothetical protein
MEQSLIVTKTATLHNKCSDATSNPREYKLRTDPLTVTQVSTKEELIVIGKVQHLK